MKRIFAKIIDKMGIATMKLILLGAIAWSVANPCDADWKSPVMADYVKVPVFASNAAKPNIMIVLDNSGSMNSLAYSDGYTGTPYNGSTASFPTVLARDDMEESLGGAMRDGGAGANDLDFGSDYVGVRFQDVTLPQGATIVSARIEFTSKGNWASVVSNLVIKGEASNDAAFLDVTVPYNISSRTATAASVAWTPGDWVDGVRYSTSDLTAVVQEIVNRGGWAAGNAMFFRFEGTGFPITTTGHREAQSREVGQAVGPILYITYIDQSAGTRYYGYFNPDYFYSYSSNVFRPQYKKVSYVPATNTWNVKTLAGASATLNDATIAPAVKSNGYWDGNWMNWMSMRRVDILRKVLMGGKATSRTGGGNQQNQGESAATGYGTFSKTFSSAAGPATSPYKGSYTYGVTETGYLNVSGSNYKIDIQKYFAIEPQDFYEGNLAGVLQRIGERARWGNMWFNEGSGSNKSGGFVQNTIDNGFGTNFLPGLQNQKCNTWTPLGETLYVATQYFAQEAVASGLDYPSQAQLFTIGKNSLKDPYWDKAAQRAVPCAKSFVLLLTDGASTKDSKIPSALMDYDGDGKDLSACNESTGTDCNYPSGGTDFLDDVALYARTKDLRADLNDDQNLLLYTVYAFDKDPNGRSLLMDAARNGGFDDLNSDGKPNGTYTDPASQRLEWDADSDGVPDTYYEATDGFELEKQLLAAIESILKRASSGTAASVVSNSRSGEGAIYQSIFYPAETINGNTVKWVGQVHALLADAHGNVREDTNSNHKLDLADDLFIVFGDETAMKYRDEDANSILDANDGGPLGASGNHTTEDKAAKYKLSELHFLWSSNGWLNNLTDAVNQRSYGSADPQRYIFTFADRDGDMAADSGEVKDFVALADPAYTQVSDPGDFLAYIYPYAPYTPPILTTDTNFEALVSRQVRRVINFTRGEDQPADEIGSLEIAAFRNRQYDANGDGQFETWRLGDIVYSTPTVVGAPAEDFDLLYKDKGYAAFYKRYQFRRNVVYVGANDGMVHAFNSGFFNVTQNEFTLKPYDTSGNEVTTGGPYRQFELGAELWAYVPYNLLPHLYWRTQPDYEHVYYTDLQPRIFDARIYPSKGATDATNPNGWATVLVCGMRFGGGKIAADIDKKDGVYNPNVDKAMSSAFAIFDITNPEEPPKLLGEITFPELGFTTCHPGVIPMRDFDTVNHTEKTNQWYLLFGSGPVSKDASNVNGANYNALIDGTSTQQAVMYAVDLVELANNGKVVTLTSSGPKTFTAAAAADPYYLVQFPETQSSVSKPITVDWNLDFNADTAYFGISFGNHTNGWNGKLRRIVMENGSDPTQSTNWTLNSTLLDLTKGSSSNLDNGQPIMASATAGTDKAGNRWLYFGTGRLYSQADKLNDDQQSYYGVKEPYTVVKDLKEFNYKEVDFDDLLNTTNIKVYNNGATVTGYSDFQALVDKIEDDYSGWRVEFDYKPGERNLGEAVLAGDVLTYTTYTPSDDPCVIAGESQVYVFYYRTGTAYYLPIIGLDTTDMSGDNALVLKRTSLGQGMTITPNIHVGREEGSRAYIQTSTGAIKPLEQDNPGAVKSGPVAAPPGKMTCP